ncbi:hypothetical protein FIV42_05705 [Persicimonas caeni]|uniref:Uncharacterized protein n=1 Tax=Persicimonas caeni TaxID=2292766 RepID=A0A4Y6PPH5_PERCE|nr:hypothetical protein [Persicimonas caeni]QDG50242.1 hypothetical protein FIV42_05705 [Persicimonas caeni]QED31463.1 hypothetical protein FRD00_05700 [Persicimonas caeni]
MSPLLRSVVTAATLAMVAPGCILSQDFGETANPSTRDTGTDTQGDDVSGDDVGGDVDDPADASDTGQDTSQDTGRDVEADVSPGNRFAPLAVQQAQCGPTPTVFELDPSNFGSARDALSADGAAPVFDLGPASRDVFADDWAVHGVAVAAPTADNKLAVGWASIDVRDFQQTPPEESVATAPLQLSGGSVADLPTGQSNTPLRIHDVEVFTPRVGASWGRFQIYNIMVFTNVGTYACDVDATRDDDGWTDLSGDCSYQALLDGGAFGPNEVRPARRMNWMPVRGTDDKQFVSAVTGGAPSTNTALFHYNPDEGWLSALTALEADNTVKWSGESSGPFTALRFAWGWPDYANDYPLIYMLDHSGEEPIAAELAYANGSGGADYRARRAAMDLPLPPSLELTEGAFSFTYRLFGAAPQQNEAITAGFIGLDGDDRGVVFGSTAGFDDADWLTYEASDITKLWAFPTGGPTLLGFARGNNRNALELASWDFATDLRTFGPAVSLSNHALGHIDDVILHSNWARYATAFDNLSPYRGLLGFSARAQAETSRGIYLLDVEDIYDAYSLCPAP